MEAASQKPILRITADEDLSDLIVRSIRDHCGMKGCTIKEIQKLIHGTYAVEIADDLDLFRLIIISCKKSIKHGRLFKHGCKYRVSFSEFSLDPPSNGATIVAEKSGEKSTVFVCELCKENGEGRQAASLSVNITKDGAQSESVWTTIDSLKKCLLCQSHMSSSLTTHEISTANSSLLSSSFADDELLSPSAVHSTCTPTKNAPSNDDHLSPAPATAPFISIAADHVNLIHDRTSTSPSNKRNRYTINNTASTVSQPVDQNQDSLQSSDLFKRGKNSEAHSLDDVDNGDSGRARKTKNRRTQVKFLTDGLTPFYSSDGKRKRPSLATGLSPFAPRPKKLRLSLDGVRREDPVSLVVGGVEGASLQGSGSANLPRLMVEVRRKKRWMYSSENHGTYQLERGVKEDILFPHITEDDVKMFELARLQARQRQLQENRSMGQSSPCGRMDQEEDEQRSRVQACEEHIGASQDCVVPEEVRSLSRNLPTDGTDPVVPAECTHPSNKPESDIPCTGSANLVDDDSDDAMNDNFADDIDDDADYGVRDDRHALDREVDGTSNNRKDMEETFDSSFGNNISIFDIKDKDNSLGGISELANITDVGGGALVKAAEDKNGASYGILCDANCMEAGDALTMKDGKFGDIDREMADDSTRCNDGRDSLSQPSNITHGYRSSSGDATVVNGIAVFGYGGGSVVKDVGLVPAVNEDVVLAQQRKVGNVFSTGLEMLSNGESALEGTSVIENQIVVNHIGPQSVSGGMSDLVNAMQQAGTGAGMSEAFPERGQIASTDSCPSGERDSAVMDNCDAVKENEIDVNCGGASAELAAFPSEVLSVSFCESLICTASPLQLNSSIISACSADIGTASADSDVLIFPSELKQMEHDQTSALSKDQYSEDVASSGSTLQMTDAVLDLPNKNVVAAPDADLVALPSKRNRRRKRFFCPDGCCSLNSDTQCETKKLEENPVKPRVGCPKGAKQKPPPQCVVMPKVPRPRGRPRKYPLPIPTQEEPSQTDTLQQLVAPPLVVQSANMTPISADETMNCSFRPEHCDDAERIQSDVVMPCRLDLNTVGIVRQDVDTSECLPCTSVSDATAFQKDSSGDGDVANAFDGKDESLVPTRANMMQEASNSAATMLTDMLSVEVVDLGVKTGFLKQGVETHYKDVDSYDGVMGRCELETCVRHGQVFEKEALLSSSGMSAFQTQTIVETNIVSDDDVRSCSRSRETLELASDAEASGVSEKDGQGAEAEMLQSAIVVKTPNVLDPDALGSCGMITEGLEPETDVAVARVFEKDLQSCSMMTGSFESELGLQDKRFIEKDNPCGGNETDEFQLELSEVGSRKVAENGLESFKAIPKRSENDFVEAGVYHYIDSAPRVVAKSDQGCGIAVSDRLTAEMIDRSKTTINTAKADLVEKNIYHCTMTQECHVQSTDLLLGSSPLGISNCQRLASGPRGPVLDPGLPSGDCRLQAAATNLLHDCYMPLNNLSSDCHIQVPVEFQVEADSSQIQLTVMPSDNRVHVLSDPSEALMRHLQLNGLASDVCSISDHRFAQHTPGTVFSSQNNVFVEACPSVANHSTDSFVTFLSTSCGATAAMQMPPNASNSVGGGVQDAPWPVQPSNLLYALPLQAQAPMANFGLNFPSNVMYALPIQSMLTGLNFERSDAPPEHGPADTCNEKPEGTTGGQSSSGPCPVHAQSARGLMPQLLGCQPYIIICPGSLPISSILQPLSDSLGQILPYLCSQSDPRQHLSCHSSVHGNFVSPLQQYSWGLQTQNTSAPVANVGQYAKVSTERNSSSDLFAPVPGHSQQLENDQQSATFNVCSIAQDNPVFTSVNASQLSREGPLAPQFVTTQNIPVPLGMRNNQADFGSVPIQLHSSGFIFPPGK